MFALDEDGEPLARPAGRGRASAVIRLDPAEPSPAPAVGDRILARLRRNDDGSCTARIVKRLGNAGERVLGIFERNRSPDGGPGRLVPVDRRRAGNLAVVADPGVADGSLVWAEPADDRAGVRVADCAVSGPPSPSLIEIHARRIPVEFSEEALAEAAAAGPVPADGRADLRSVPLVTIDGDDARDFDDAVWAAPDPDSPGGWRIVVAIADVAWYVREGSALDACARARGNSVYFPDRVVPMLPGRLSDGLCSLVPGEERGCVAAEIRIDSEGRTLRHRFRRAVMRSAARLTYEQVEAIRAGATAAPDLADAVGALYGAFGALRKARARRGALDFDAPEIRVVLDANGAVTAIRPQARLDSHRLIEEFMIAANVAAAETLSNPGVRCMYRVHDRPSPTALRELRQLLQRHGIALKKRVPGPETFRNILDRVAGSTAAAVVGMAVLRCQARAEYSPRNIGHFGLGLRRYAHFTSPIRRYADLLVHRLLVHTLGDGPEPGGDLPGGLAGLGRHLSMTERRAADAERGAADRYAAAFLKDHVGAPFAARIGGVGRAGLFVALEESGAGGFVPFRLAGDERFEPAGAGSVAGERTGTVHQVGDRLVLRLEEADERNGTLVFSVPESAVSGPFDEDVP